MVGGKRFRDPVLPIQSIAEQLRRVRALQGILFRIVDYALKARGRPREISRRHVRLGQGELRDGTARIDHERPVGEGAGRGPIVSAGSKAGKPGQRAMDMLSLDRPALDWIALAKGMGVPGRSVSTADDFNKALAEAIAEKGPRLIEVQMG